MNRFQIFRSVINTAINNIKFGGPRGVLDENLGGQKDVLDDVVSNFGLLNWCKVSSTNRSRQSLVGT